MALESAVFGVPIQESLPSSHNPYVPRFVEICTNIIEGTGLQTIGIYAIPGNKISISEMIKKIDSNYNGIVMGDPRWTKLHVVTSLLKCYFRDLPDTIVTLKLYPLFTKAGTIQNPKARMEELRILVRSLPKHNYFTLKHLIYHLKRVESNRAINKMEVKSLAMIFGPCLFNRGFEDLQNIRDNIINKYRIVESLLIHVSTFMISIKL